jgi:hypothetical protein
MQNVGKAFSFMFEDKNWVVKIILGAVCNLSGNITRTK